MRNPLILATLAIALLTGCGGGSSSGGGGGTQPISVVFGTAPPATIGIGTTTSVSAVVSNDTAGAGVNWSCTPAAACGSFLPTSTASSATTVYTAPASVPTGASVTITASSVSDASKTAHSNVAVTAPTITITFSTPPPSSLSTNGTATIVATTSGDPANPSMLNWSCTPTGSCGSFLPTSTASGSSTVYTAPAASPQGGSVTITAAPATDYSQTKSATVTIANVASNSSLKGQYAFLLFAPTGPRGTAAFVGSVNLDGAGNVLGGMEDVVSTLKDDQADPILATSTPSTSIYSVDPSGHGSLTMNTHNGETLIVSYVVTSPSHAEVVEVDGYPGSGTLDLQTPVTGGFNISQISGNYSFTMDGTDTANPPTSTIALGGVFNTSGTGAINSGSIDVATGGTVSTDIINSGTIYQLPDANGRGRFSLVVPAPGVTRSFTFYIVNSKVLRMFEDDGADYSAGSAYSQGTTSTALTGTFVYRHSGWSVTNTPKRTVAAGQFTASAGLISTGISDSNTGGAPTVATTAVAVSGNLSATPPSMTDAAGTSTFKVYPVDSTLNILDPNNSSGKGGALLLHTDANIAGTGVIASQSVSGSPTFTGNYALNLANRVATTTPNELDLIAVLSSDGAGNFINGLADYDQNNTVSGLSMLGAEITGTFTADGTHAGRFTGSFSIVTPNGGYTFIPGAALTTTFPVSIYQASTSQAFVIETDTQASTDGVLIQQAPF